MDFPGLRIGSGGAEVDLSWILQEIQLLDHVSFFKKIYLKESPGFTTQLSFFLIGGILIQS